jgi:hypothetical protein
VRIKAKGATKEWCHIETFSSASVSLVNAGQRCIDELIMSYTNTIFVPGQRYRVKQNFKSGPSTFIAGEILIFERDTFSPYDNCFVSVFRSETGAETKEWWLSESQSKELWQQYFEPPPGPA